MFIKHSLLFFIVTVIIINVVFRSDVVRLMVFKPLDQVVDRRPKAAHHGVLANVEEVYTIITKQASLLTSPVDQVYIGVHE